MTRFFPAMLLLALLTLGACAAIQEDAPSSAPPPESDERAMTEDIRDLVEEQDGRIVIEQCRKAGNGIRRDQCYRYSAGLQAITANEPPQEKSVKTVRKSSTAASGKKVEKTSKVVVKGRCQPQCLIYARCRSGFMSCRLGNTNPLSWWPCAKGLGLTSQAPVPGSVMLLEKQGDASMRVGHAVYVEEVCALKDGRFLLRVSHANYNRRCSLDLDAKVLYTPRTRTAGFLTGAWAKWAKDLKAFGFVTG
ncbi:MAG: hypothetical protein LBC79_02920 [Deltaproteobacteria bacterium]|jgi:hypothetical protein|nr:hypothetical protein [Deltaproteobacteria bacterium]